MAIYLISDGDLVKIGYSKHPNNGQGICGEHSGCWNLDIAIECTKTYIDNFNL